MIVADEIEYGSFTTRSEITGLGKISKSNFELNWFSRPKVKALSKSGIPYPIKKSGVVY